MLHSEERSPVIEGILKEHHMQTVEIPKLADLLGKTHPSFPFTKRFEDAKNEPLVVLHTSGTTGLPKPVTWTHDWAASFAQQRMLTPPQGFQLCDDMLSRTRLLSLMPPFHVSRDRPGTSVPFPLTTDLLMLGYHADLIGCTFVCQYSDTALLWICRGLSLVWCRAICSHGCEMP